MRPSAKSHVTRGYVRSTRDVRHAQRPQAPQRHRAWSEPGGPVQPRGGHDHADLLVETEGAGAAVGGDLGPARAVLAGVAERVDEQGPGQPKTAPVATHGQ